MLEITKFVVGLTGGIASGKSTVANFFQDLDVEVVSADAAARSIMHAGSDLIKKIDSVFQAEYDCGSLLTEQAELDRGKLRNIIFNSDLARRRLDELTHPPISAELVRLIELATSPYVVAEIPLLIEANMQAITDQILVVETDTETQLERVMQRDEVSKEQAQKILEVQLSNQQRHAYANDIIHNQGNLDKVKNAVSLLHQTYLKLAAGQTRNAGLVLH